MGLFGIEMEKKQNAEGAFDTIIGEKAKFKGELSSSGAVRVNGQFEGKLTASGELIIAPGSKITGDVRGGSVIVSGKVDGNITASHSLEITKSGRVHGDLAGGKIIIEEGSSYRGKVRVESSAGPSEVEPAEEQPAEEQPMLQDMETVVAVEEDSQTRMFQNA